MKEPVVIGHHSLDETFPPEPSERMWRWNGQSFYRDWPLTPEYKFDWVTTEADDQP